ncbi:proteasome subunit beta [Pseudomonas monteilii]|uniref:proteasome subunit beta n=1 Tax=Pseudomonas monteilii TaxID=76759 RepID=UPI001E55DE8C|nr:proteasome subunit beta [Pseudomonas monteilii]MCE1010273.1 proteasome subunit beta [Pseudomonas monteilii]
MTTIAYKDGVIAYDSRVTRGDLITDDDCDKCIERDGVKFFLTGAVCDYDALVGAYFGTSPSGKVDASAIVLHDGNLMMVAVDDDTGLWKSPLKADRPYAIGSGTPYAFAAMDMGASAEKAVEMAARRDTSTGGRVRTQRVDQHGAASSSI